MKKAIAEEHFDKFGELELKAITARSNGDLRKAVSLAVACLEYIPGMMRYCSYDPDIDQIPTIEAIEIICEYAPIFFDSDSIASVRDLLRAKRSVNKNTEQDMIMLINQAEETQEVVFKIWDQLERSGSTAIENISIAGLAMTIEDRQILDDMVIAGVVEELEIDGNPHIRLMTDLRREAIAICGWCGVKLRGMKSSFLLDNQCPRCGVISVLILVS